MSDEQRLKPSRYIVKTHGGKYLHYDKATNALDVLNIMSGNGTLYERFAADAAIRVHQEDIEGQVKRLEDALRQAIDWLKSDGMTSDEEIDQKLVSALRQESQ